jgi:hypothetical protein
MVTYLGNYRTDTLLSLARYADFMGIDPIRFFGGTSTLHTTGACDDTWYEYRWQDGGKVSRKEILEQIAIAEYDIAKAVGYWPAPRWINAEPHNYPQYYEPRLRNNTGKVAWNYKSIHLDWGYVQNGGQRATTEITTATHGADVDTTGDGWNDMEVWTITGVDFDPDEIHAYFKVYNAADAENCRTDLESVGADPAWEIRDIRVQHNATTDVATVYIPRYQLFKPQLQRRIDPSPIDVVSDTNFVDDVVFYRVYNDPETQITFMWTSEEGCESVACAWSVQSGCLQVSNKRRGEIIATPGTYDSDENTFTEAEFSENLDPHKLLAYYYAGYKDPYARGRDQLSPFWVRMIATLATARIPRRLCTCENVQMLVDRWQEDAARIDGERSYNTGFDIGSPFGTKVGEIQVWRALKGRGIKKGTSPNLYA